MITLNQDTLTNSRTYLTDHCRKLDLERFINHFENENIEGVLSALSTFQNPDGGFGQGLESDFFLPDSSPLATSVAFGILAELNVSSSEPIVQSGIEYLLNTYDSKSKRWDTVPATVNDYPHAPWWHFKEGEGSALDKYWGNPTAEIIGYLVKYSDLVPNEFLTELVEHTIGVLLNHPDSMEMHELYCFLRFSATISVENFNRIRDKLVLLVTNAVTTEPESWAEYGAQPLDFVKSPDSFLHPSLKEHVPANLDHWINTMTADGVWLPTWSWGQYEEAWLEAKQNIIGGLIVDRLKVLDRFQRIAI